MDLEIWSFVNSDGILFHNGWYRFYNLYLFWCKDFCQIPPLSWNQGHWYIELTLKLFFMNMLIDAWSLVFVVQANLLSPLPSPNIRTFKQGLIFTILVWWASTSSGEIFCQATVVVIQGIIFWRDFAIFSHFLHEIAYKVPEWEKKSHFEVFSFHAAKSLRTCRPFRDIQTILHDWFSDYFCATIRFLYSCWKLQHHVKVCAVGVPLKW